MLDHTSVDGGRSGPQRSRRPGRGVARRRQGRLGLLAAALSALLALLSPAAASADPARFVYESCDSALPGGGVPEGTSFSVNPGVPLTPFDNCAVAGGAMGITETGHTAATFAYWAVPIAATPYGYVESLTVSALAYGLGPGNDHTFVYRQGWPANDSTETQRIFHVHEAPTFFFPGTEVTILMNCDGNYAPGCEAGPTVAAHYFAATEVDPSPPTVAVSGGSTTEGGVLRGDQTLSGVAKDRGGGLTKLSVLVNGEAAATKTLSCATAYANNPSVKGIVATSPTPCPSQASGEWTLDTEVPPFREGENTIELCASDFATIGDPNTSCTAARGVSVDNSCTASAVSGGEILAAQLAGSNAETETVAYGRATEVIGHLADNAGDPVPGATLCVKAATLGLDRPTMPVGAVQTDANGNYSYKVAPGPDRELMIGYRHDRDQVAREVRVYAHVRPTLSASAKRLRNGRRIHFRGRLPGPNRRGRVVVLQANVLGARRWITFRRATSGRRGIFRASYHFTSTTRPTTYRFRALVPRQAGYPWVQGRSRPVEVRVTP